jgi:hypothetical protein
MNLFDVLEEVYKRLGQWNESVATGGTTTTIVDSKLAGEGSDDDWVEGAAFIVYDAAGASAAPEGELRRISDYTDSSGTFTVDTAFSAAPAAGDRYAYTSSYFPYQTMISIVNTALQGLGDIPVVDENISTAAGQTEYELSTTLKRYPPYQVLIQGNTSDSNDNAWIEKSDWYYEPATAGSSAYLVFKRQPTSGRTLQVWYRVPHPYVQAATDSIYEGFHQELVTRAVVYQAYLWQNARLQGGDDFLLQREQLAEKHFLEAMQIFPVWRPKKRPRLMTMQKKSVRYPGNVSDLV